MFRLTMVGLTLAALTACGGGGSGGDEREHEVDVSVASSAAATPAGLSATFTATVQNAGDTAAEDVSLTLTLTEGYEAESISCTAAGGATCPETGTTMTVDSLPAHGSLTFVITVPIPEDSRGEVAVAVNMTVDGDEDESVPSDSTVAHDPRNDSYRVFATNGYEYTLTVDFDARTYQMTGEGLDTSGSFTHDAGTGTYTISGNSKFRVGADILVGGFDYGTGVVPFVAARRFVTSLDELAGDMTSFGLNNPGTVNADSRIFGSKWGDGTLKACLQNAITTVDQCAPASVWTYQLSIAGDVITGFEAARNDTITFRVAKSGSTQIYLRAGLGSSGRNFRIGVPEAPNGLADGTFHGSSTLGGWGTATLTNTSYELNGFTAAGQAWTDSATLTGIGTLQGIRVGPRASDGAFVFVMQAAPIAVLVGARGGPAAGYMEIGAR